MTVTVDKMSGRAVCDVCGEKVVRREHIQSMVEREQFTMVARTDVQWRAQQVGASSMYLSRDKTVARKVLPALRCNCDSLHGFSATRKILREGFREQLQSIFGDELPLALLFQLPTEWVAWENSTLVSVSGEGHLVLSDVGRKLSEVIVGMTMRGELPRPPPATLDTVVRGYSYLFMLQPLFRSAAAAELGPRATVGELFRRFPVDSFDWDSMATMRLEVKDDGTVMVDKQMAYSAVHALAAHFAFLRAKPLAKGSVATDISVCLQVMPTAMAGANAERLPEVALDDGLSFVPAGEVVLHGYEKVVNFEPGVTLHLPSGTRVSHRFRGIALFLSGSVKLRISVRDSAGDHDYGALPTSELADCTVGVVVESYNAKTNLGRWYTRVFDACSTTARFASQYAELLVLRAPARAYEVVEPTNSRELDFDGSGMQAVFERRMVFDGLDFGVVYGLQAGLPVVYRRRYFTGRTCKVLFNDSVQLSDRGALATLCGLTFECLQDTGWVSPVDDVSSRVEFDEVSIADEYVIDGGGPSDSDGYVDETGTHVQGTSDLWMLSEYLQFGDDHVRKRYPYLTFVSDIPTALKVLGAMPKLEELLALPGSVIDWLAVERNKLELDECGRLLVKVGNVGSFWSDVAKALVIIQSQDTMIGDTFATGLVARYARDVNYYVGMRMFFAINC